MIARVAGILQELAEGSVVVDTGSGLWHELLVPACDVARMGGRLGHEVIFHTIHFVEGDPAHGVQTPRLIGFLSPEDRDFFRLFTRVKGIGVRKALRALASPVGQIAAAIQNKDAAFLVALPEIGKRTAEQIIAELHGKVDEFAAASPAAPAVELPEAAAEALAVLVQLGERRADAAAIIERVLAVAPDLPSEEIIRHAFKMKAGAT